MIKSHLGERSQYALQAEQLNWHAVMQAQELLGGKQGTTLSYYRDTPLLTAETLKTYSITIKVRMQVRLF